MLGTLSLFVLLTINYFIAIVFLVRLLKAKLRILKDLSYKNMKRANSWLSIPMVLVFLAHGSIIAIMYILNVIRFGTFDFETIISLISPILIYISLIFGENNVKFTKKSRLIPRPSMVSLASSY